MIPPFFAYALIALMAICLSLAAGYSIGYGDGEHHARQEHRRGERAANRRERTQ